MLFLFSSEPVTESKSLDGMDLNCVPETKTLSNDYLLEKKRLAEAQQKKHKPTRASWAKSLDDDNDVRCMSVGITIPHCFIIMNVELYSLTLNSLCSSLRQTCTKSMQKLYNSCSTPLEINEFPP